MCVNGVMASPSPTGMVEEVTPRSPLAGPVKVFVARDFSRGLGVRFQTEVPIALHGSVEQDVFEQAVEEINDIFSEAESTGCATVGEGCLACVTAYLAYVCLDTHYEKCLKRAGKLVAEQNARIWEPRGLRMSDPVERGLRVIEIQYLAADKNDSAV